MSRFSPGKSRLGINDFANNLGSVIAGKKPDKLLGEKIYFRRILNWDTGYRSSPILCITSAKKFHGSSKRHLSAMFNLIAMAVCVIIKANLNS